MPCGLPDFLVGMTAVLGLSNGVRAWCKSLPSLAASLGTG